MKTKLAALNITVVLQSLMPFKFTGRLDKVTIVLK